MPRMDRIWLATLTKNSDDAGTDEGQLNVTVNIDGIDVHDRDYAFLNGSGFLSSGLGPDSAWLGDGQAGLSDETLQDTIELADLTNSSVRVGIRGDDAWAPFKVALLGQSERRVELFAMEEGLSSWLSTDRTEGKLTMPVRLVGQGSSSTVIRRLLLLVYTRSGIDVETDSPIQLQVTAAGALVAQATVPDTPQDDLEQYTANWYEIPVAAGFTRGDVLGNGEIRLGILGTDAWVPDALFLYGLDTLQGRPTEAVHLVSLPSWNLGTLSADPQEGQQSVALPVI